MNSELLMKLGLSRAQADVYAVLLTGGQMKAGEIAKKSIAKRGLVYKALEDLEKLNLIERAKQVNKPDVFLPKHPENLRSLVEEELHRAKDAEVLFSSHLGSLSSLYNLAVEKPGVNIYDGLEGLKIVYSEINAKYDHFKLMRSYYDHDDKKIATLVEKQIQKQIENDIESQVLTHVTPKAIDYALAYEDNRSPNNPRFITDADFKLPAQIVIYGNKVAITDFPSMLITTIIENKAIKDTFDLLFDFMWKNTEAGHECVMKEQRQKKLGKVMRNPDFR